jgi:hypothetical protein
MRFGCGWSSEFLSGFGFQFFESHKPKISASVALLHVRRAGMQWPEPLEVRREILSALIKEIKTASIELSESLAANTKELVRVAKGFGFEGIVAKRKDSVYESGKRPARGSSTGSTVGRSLSSADTRQGIRLTC